MNNQNKLTVFFDIGDTLGTAKILPPPPHYRLEKLEVYAYIQDILQGLKNRDIRLGIISNIGEDSPENVARVFREAQIDEFFNPELLVYGAKNSPEIFNLAAQKAGNNPEECVFVGEDSRERLQAVTAGWRVVPHPLLITEVLAGRKLRYIRVNVTPAQQQQNWRQSIRHFPLVPLYVTGEGGNLVYAIATTNTISQLDDLGFAVDRLGNEDAPLTRDLYLLRDDRQTSTGFLVEQGHSAHFFSQDDSADWVLASSSEGLFVALPAGRSVEEYHFEEAYHGHNFKLMPDLSLLEPFGTERQASFLQIPTTEPDLSPTELAKLQEITPNVINYHLDRYSGIQPLDGEKKIISRHIQHPDNAKATEALAKDLTAIGGDKFTVRMQPFVHEGQTLYNVEAEMQGDKPDEIVLITAHLDSTAAFSDHFDAPRDIAPGRDDDASGVAAVLAIADIFQQLASNKPPKRSLRFVLFNAEEHGLIGSKAYARAQAAIAAPIVAVYQMDMIGYNQQSPKSFEVHVGYPQGLEVQERSLILAQRLERLASKISPQLEPVQIYTNPDPAAGRSDHASFHERGYAACVVSEDFFAGPHTDSPAPEANPNYHMKTDTFVDLEYAAEIARAIAAAAWVTANL
ncbi:M20/M25/M40 family metallo-hydrolase [Merismopedia glauca]|uniref:Peptidase M28 n=1 Tax=Merismopedia glauca CCAP 1448/3 TaxID=1296344 RepID=A0A2T1CA36_9CYAN|nr:M28 family peptidase [Merismopedia glauca]PSB05126.1 peptidase M28 [Merismopedia glauca CCAP 1448/3]